MLFKVFSKLSLFFKLSFSDGDSFMKREIGEGGNMLNMPSDMKDTVHGVKMGVSSDICDNAKVSDTF